MKKRLIAFALASVSALGGLSFAACKNETKEQADLPENYTRLYGFESYGEFMSVTQLDYFGKYALCTDKKYVKQGDSSVKLEVSGGGAGNDKPGLCFTPQLLGENKQNFSKAERVVFDIYNAESTAKTCYFDAFFATGGEDVSAGEVSYELKPESWTKCVYDLDYDSLSFVYDLSQCKSLRLRFDGVKLGEEKPVFYLDELLVKSVSGERAEPEIALEKDEICDFEKDYQQNIMFFSGYGAYTPYLPEASINTDKKYVSHGEKSLKLHIPHGSNQQSCYVLMIFSQKLIEKLNFASYGEDYDIVFDFYNDSDSTFFLESQLWAANADGTTRGLYGVALDTTPRTWTKCRLSLAEFLKRVPEKEDETPALEAVSSFRINYGDFVGSGPEDDKDVYIDNIRFEKREK